MFTCDMKSRIPLGIQQKIQISRNTTLLLIEVVDIRFVLFNMSYSNYCVKGISCDRNMSRSWGENCY